MRCTWLPSTIRWHWVIPCKKPALVIFGHAAIAYSHRRGHKSRLSMPCRVCGVCGGYRDDDELSEAEDAAGASANGAGREKNGHANGGGGRLAQGAQALEITYTRRSRYGQLADVVRLSDIDDDLESRCVCARPSCAVISSMYVRSF